jgi:hypothetical protein
MPLKASRVTPPPAPFKEPTCMICCPSRSAICMNCGFCRTPVIASMYFSVSKPAVPLPAGKPACPGPAASAPGPASNARSGVGQHCKWPHCVCTRPSNTAKGRRIKLINIVTRKELRKASVKERDDDLKASVQYSPQSFSDGANELRVENRLQGVFVIRIHFKESRTCAHRLHTLLQSLRHPCKSGVPGNLFGHVLDIWVLHRDHESTIVLQRSGKSGKQARLSDKLSSSR